MKFDPEKCLQDLEKLGNSPDDIANSLKSAGIKGIRGISTSCPIANYLKSKYEGIELTVGATKVVVAFYESWGQASFNIKNSEALEKFISKFDNIEYPDLMEQL